MKDVFLVVTSIANHDNPCLKQYAKESSIRNIPFIVIGDTKSPDDFNLDDCDFYSLKRQKSQEFELAKILPTKHYARKNIGYLLAISKGAETIIETDDDNFPFPEFWNERKKQVNTRLFTGSGWTNIYAHFTDARIWPRGFALENIQNTAFSPKDPAPLVCPIQQGLADKNPDVDAIYRLTSPLPITFNRVENIALGENSICPFNSQNTTWFREAFPLLYLPSFCSFRMTDIWRSFVAQRIAWTCGWSILFHNSTVWQERNDHSLMNDFKDEIPGYLHNQQICATLKGLDLQKGVKYIPENMMRCYQELVSMGIIGQNEINLLRIWLNDVESLV